VVVSFTPKQFYVAQQERNYTGLFSDLHANELLFNDALTLTIKQRVASRMINYPKSLAKDPTLGFIAAHMQYGKASAPYEYYLMYPYSKLRTTIKQLQDEARTLTYMDSKKPHPINTTPGKYANTSQAELLRLAEAEDRNQSSSNDIGLYNRFASKHPDDLVQKPIGSGDKGFLDVLNSSKEYSDFKLMLDILKQLGAQPMLLSRPIKEQLYTRMGVSVPTQEKYYAKMTKLITPYNFDYEDFHQYDTNSYFGADIAPHTGATGWVYVNQELDRFYHAN
jgi:poly-D-alanine transfer protein DltD